MRLLQRVAFADGHQRARRADVASRWRAEEVVSGEGMMYVVSMQRDA